MQLHGQGDRVREGGEKEVEGEERDGVSEGCGGTGISVGST